MVVKKVVEFNNIIHPVSFVRPILDYDGNIMKDTCITDHAELYKWSSYQKSNYMDECEKSDMKVHYDNRGRAFTNLNPLLNNYNNCQIVRILLYEFDDGKYPPDHYKHLQVDHINPSIPLDNSLYNLQWVDRNTNMKNAALTGVMCKKYTLPTVHKVCEMICDGVDRQTISKELNIDVSLIDDVRSGRSHKTISVNYLDKGFKYSDKHRRPREERLIEANKICKLLEEGRRNYEVCRELGVESGLVTSIMKGESYKDVSCNYNIKIRKS